MTNVWYDEAASITGRTTGWSPPQQVKVVRPINVHCRYCGAKPGASCQRWRRTKRGKVRQNRDSPHQDRKYDARLATQALRALT